MGTFPLPKKRLGQHFLTAPYYAQRIAEAIGSVEEGTVVEIGPGRGALSVFLKKRHPGFHLIEMDNDVVPLLKENLGEGAWTLHQADALSFDFSILPAPIHCIGNLPYNVGAMIIRRVLFVPQVASMTFMVQREVAQRIVSPPNSKEFGFLSILVQYFGAPKILFHVPPGAFYPKPKVDSSVFRMCIDQQLSSRLPEQQREPFFSFVSNNFQMRRKTILNNLLKRCGDRELLLSILGEIGIDPQDRPEDIAVAQWLELFRRCGESGACSA